MLHPIQSMHRTEARNGMRIGLVGGLLLTAYHLINNLADLPARPQAWLSWVTFAALLAVFAWAGLQGARATGRRVAGIVAAGWAGLVSAAISFVTLFAISALFLGAIRRNGLLLEDFARSGSQNLNAFIFEDALGGSLFLLGFGVVAGAICGAVGAFIYPRRP